MVKSDKWYLNTKTGQIDIGDVWCCTGYADDDSLQEWPVDKPVHSFVSGSHHGTKTATYMPISGCVDDEDFAGQTWQSTYWQTEEHAAQAWEDHDAMFVEHVE